MYYYFTWREQSKSEEVGKDKPAIPETHREKEKPETNQTVNKIDIMRLIQRLFLGIFVLTTE